MSPFRLAWIQVIRHPLTSLLLIGSLALAIAAASMANTLTAAAAHATRTFEPPYEAVVGPKSESLALVLEALTLREPSEDVIPRAIMERTRGRVDTVHVTGFHVLTRHEGDWVLAVDESWWSHPDQALRPTLVQGRVPSRAGEVAVGHPTASRLGIEPGDRITLRGSPSQAMVRAAQRRAAPPSIRPDFDPSPHPFRAQDLERPLWETQVEVVGILQHPSTLDEAFHRALFVHTDTGHDYQQRLFDTRIGREVSAQGAMTYILVDWRDPSAWDALVALIHHGSTAQLVHIAQETATLERLGHRTQRGGQLLATLVLMLAFLSVGVLLNARFDRLLPRLGLLRAVGYRRGDIALSIAAEALWIALPAVGLAACLEGIALWSLRVMRLIDLDVAWPSLHSVGLWISAPFVAVLALTVPLVRLYRTDLRTLLLGL